MFRQLSQVTHSVQEQRPYFMLQVQYSMLNPLTQQDWPCHSWYLRQVDQLPEYYTVGQSSVDAVVDCVFGKFRREVS